MFGADPKVCGEEAAVHVVVGPIVTRDGGYAFDSWTPEKGLHRGYSYRRIEDAHYARKVEIGSRARSFAGPMVACSTLDEFSSVLANGASPDRVHAPL
jgi:hypothetical protein